MAPVSNALEPEISTGGKPMRPIAAILPPMGSDHRTVPTMPPDHRTAPTMPPDHRTAPTMPPDHRTAPTMPIAHEEASAPQIIALFGPTAVGKTAIAVALAERLRALGEDPVAVSADAMQVYEGLEILTGVASAAERAQLEHRLVSFLPLEQTFSVGRYAQLAHAEIDALLAVGRRPIVVGGTGLYLRAALCRLDLRPQPAPGARERWQAELASRGAPSLHATLAASAPWAAARIDINDSQRLVRALELLEQGALVPADRPSQLWSDELRRPALLVGLTMERAELYQRIDQRVDRMLAAGAQQEVIRAAAAGASATARRALGFSELLDGDPETLKRRTRNYARRQLTWMRKLAQLHTIDVTRRPPDDVAAEILAADTLVRRG